MKKSFSITVLFFLLIMGFTHCTSSSSLEPSSNAVLEEDPNPAEELLGERLFRETRFAQYFFANAQDLNSPLTVPDPIMELTQTTGAPLPGAFAGKSMNCAACHMVDDHLATLGGGMRTYADFARRSPIPLRGDGRTVTVRNSPPLVNSALPRDHSLLFHFDGEFPSMEALVEGTLTGRNFGWLVMEKNKALHHIAEVIRQDLGEDELAEEFGAFSYARLLKGDLELPEDLRIPQEFIIDVSTASDQEIVTAVAKLISVYVNNLVFNQDSEGLFNASPYDQFLIKNQLPRAPEAGETSLEYSQRLLKMIEAKSEFQWVEAGNDGSFAFHDQAFFFGPQELEGLKIFFREPPATPLSEAELTAGKIGNCIACHGAPNFTDFRFHNTGATQAEFDSVHGESAFQNLWIPGLAERNAQATLYLPPNGQNLNGIGKFFDIPSLDKPGHTDLGLWNVFANPGVPGPQAGLLNLVCEQANEPSPICNASTLLPKTIAQFKTPGLRDLGHSAPFMHTGQMDTLQEVLEHYQDFSALVREGKMRNPPPEFEKLVLTDADLEPLEAFLKSLNEDYE